MSDSGIALGVLIGVLVILLTISIIVNIYCFMRYGKKFYNHDNSLLFIDKGGLLLIVPVK